MGPERFSDLAGAQHRRAGQPADLGLGLKHGDRHDWTSALATRLGAEPSPSRCSSQYWKPEATVVSARYQSDATISSSMTWKLRAYMSSALVSNSWAPMTETSEVFFNMPIVWLAVGGVITLSAWGRTIWLITCVSLRPTLTAASLWPLSTEFMP